MPDALPIAPREPMSSVRLAALDAVARCIAPHAFESVERGELLVLAIVRRVEQLQPDSRRDLEASLDLLENRWATLATGHHPLPFHLLATEEQIRLLTQWTRSRVGALRTVVQAIRRLVHLGEYDTTDPGHAPVVRGTPSDRRAGQSGDDSLSGTPVDDRLASPRPPEEPARDHPANDARVIRAEVVVIGMGVGGAVAAARLAEAGHDVLLIEERPPGPELGRSEGGLHHGAGDGILRATDDMAVSLPEDSVVGNPAIAMAMAMRRTPDWVLDEWHARHGCEGMLSRDLAPIFARLENDVGAVPILPEAYSTHDRRLLDGAGALGWAALAGCNDRESCVRAGACHGACRRRSGVSAVQVFLSRARAAGARVISPARVDRIEFVERGGAFPLKRLLLSIPGPHAGTRTLAVEAPIVVVSAGAVETPVLLQRSGLGGDGVGRFLRLHPSTAVMGRFDGEISDLSGGSLSAVCEHHLRFDDSGYGFWMESMALAPVFSAVVTPGFGAEHREMMLLLPQLASLIARVRDGADVDRSGGEVTATRRGRVRVRYRLGPRDSLLLVEAMVASARVHLAAGAREVRTLHVSPLVIRHERDLHLIRSRSIAPNDVGLFATQLTGTCRLGADRATSGTDPHGERYGAPGVFVADGTLLPTAPGVDPEETIMALATLVAERIAARRRPG